MALKGFTDHDHSSCVSETLASVAKACEARGLQLTQVRRRVLELLLEQHQAQGAYQILDRLRDEGLGSQPPVAYRALDFLVSNGFAHKIERLNAFVACLHPVETHTPVFLICSRCGCVAESLTDLASGQLGDAATQTGFEIERLVVEAEGVCPDCQDAA